MSAPPPDDGVTRRVELKGLRIDLAIAVRAPLVGSLPTMAIAARAGKVAILRHPRVG